MLNNNIFNPTTISWSKRDVVAKPLRTMFMFPVLSKYTYVIESLQWSGTQENYKLTFSTFTVKKLFDNVLGISVDWNMFVSNMYVVFSNRNLTVNNVYGKKMNNTATIILILCAWIFEKNSFIEIIAEQIVSRKKSSKADLSLQKFIRQYTRSIDKKNYKSAIYFILGYIAYTKLYTGLMLGLLKVFKKQGRLSEYTMPSLSKKKIPLGKKIESITNELPCKGDFYNYKEILNKIKFTQICKDNVFKCLYQIKYSDILGKNKNNIGNCILYSLVLGRCLSELVVMDLGDILDKYSVYYKVYDNIFFSDLLTKQNIGSGSESDISVIALNFFNSLETTDEKIIALFDKIIYFYNMYWGLYILFVDSVDLQYSTANKYRNTNERISQKNVFKVLKRNSYIERVLADYSLSSSVRTVSAWQEFATTQPEIIVLTFFNQFLIYFIKEDLGYSLLYMCISKQVHNQLNGLLKNGSDTFSAGIIGNTHILYLVQFQGRSVRQNQLDYYYRSLLESNSNSEGVDTPKNTEYNLPNKEDSEEAHEKKLMGQRPHIGKLQKMNIEKKIMNRLIRSLVTSDTKTQDNKNINLIYTYLKELKTKDSADKVGTDDELMANARELYSGKKILKSIANKITKKDRDLLEELVVSLKKSNSTENPYHEVMSIKTVLMKTTVLNPELFLEESDEPTDKPASAAAAAAASKKASSATFHYYEIVEVEPEKKLNKKLKQGDDEMLVILDNGFIVLLEKGIAFTSVARMVYGQIVKDAESNYILYKPYVPFDRVKPNICSSQDPDTPEEWELCNTEVCRYTVIKQTDSSQKPLGIKIKFACFMPYDFELGNLLARVLINIGINFGGKQKFTDNFSKRPQIIRVANTVVKQAINIYD